MMSNAALEAGVASLVLKFSLAGWAAILILLGCDPRKSATSASLILACVILLASFRGLWVAGGLSGLGVVGGLWWLSVIAASIVMLIQLKQWRSISPVEIYDEAKEQNAAKKKTQKSRRSSRKVSEGQNGQQSGGIHVAFWISLAGWLAASFALILGSSELQQLSGITLAIAGIHVITAPTLMGLAVVCGFQLSFLSNPDALSVSAASRVRWQGIARIALLCAFIEVVFCAAVFMSPTVGQDFQAGLLTRLFAFTLLVISYTTWMIPHRIAVFQQSGQPKGWASHAIASWLSVLTLAVVCALPASWPWQAI